jgi:hypothetical protein
MGALCHNGRTRGRDAPAHINYEASGIDKQPTIQFSGVNLQVIDGSGSETTINGTGNLILGYDETPGTQTGSHNLLLGGTGNSDSSYGGVVGGAGYNKISGAYASVLGGAANTASGYASTITGGYANRTTATFSTVSGGCSNLAGSGTPSVNAFCTNTTRIGDYPSILGGMGNQASAENSSVSGGALNLASNLYASISAGKENKATGEGSSISGGGRRGSLRRRFLGNGRPTRQGSLLRIHGPRWTGGSDRSGIRSHAVRAAARSRAAPVLLQSMGCHPAGVGRLARKSHPNLCVAHPQSIITQLSAHLTSASVIC